MITSENLRFHAAGHLAAAHSLIDARQYEAASHVIGLVRDFAKDKSVNAPPAVHEKLAHAADDPEHNKINVSLLEEWFVHPFNTVIEKSGSF